ncbi:unnamed protein product [Thelazia callipaeda]|uniref:Kinetochore associated 1 n=1 Tax=Thelazia callipaeda TaxID=103827 RepID=A0A0N5CZS2_THECL|nr:unnamed protein product [Thelazia callipaeda]
MSYQLKKEEWSTKLDEDERITDWSSVIQPNYVLAVFLTDKGKVLMYHQVGKEIKHSCTHLNKLAPTVNEASIVCFLADASGLTFILPKGNVLLAPINSILDVPWGRCNILTKNAVSILEVSGVEEGCLCIPTSALCYNGLQSLRPYLIYANKAGQLFIIDLTMMVVSVIVRAPESIHDLALFSSRNTVHLLISGFTGKQWILPLETGDRGLRETLSRVIPWDLKEQSQRRLQISVTPEGMLAVLNSEDCVVKFYDDIEIRTEKNCISVPQNTWQVYKFSHTVFAFTDQTPDFGTSIYFSNLFKTERLFYEKILDFTEGKVFGMIPIFWSSVLPICLLVTEHGVISLSPAKSISEFFVEYVAKHDYDFRACKSVAITFVEEDSTSFIPDVFDITLSNLEDCKNQQLILTRLIHFALDLSVPLTTVIQWCTKHRCEYALMEIVKNRCAENPNELSKHHMIEICVARYEIFPQERDKIETTLCNFLVHHPNVHLGMERLFSADFWNAISIVVDNIFCKATAVAVHLTRTENDWPTTYNPFIVKILAFLFWEFMEKDDAKVLLRRMTEYLPHLKSLPHFTSFAKVAFEQLSKYPHEATVLYVLSSLRLLQGAYSTYLSSPTKNIISSGSNVISVLTSEETVGYWGEFSLNTCKVDYRSFSKQHISHLRMLDIPVRVCSISCGTEHLLCLTVDGKIYTIGRNRFGQCGVGHTEEVMKATEVIGTYGDASIICAGHYHSALINSKGFVFTWGWSFYGQLGIDCRSACSNMCIPTLVTSLKERVVSVACGYAHTLFLSESGVVYACGNGTYGQLGNGLEIKKRYEPEAVVIPEKIIMIASKYFHCLAVSKKQKIYCWGIDPRTLKTRVFVKRKSLSETNKALPSTEKKTNKPSVSRIHLSVAEVKHMVRGKIQQIDAGYNHSALIDHYRILYTWGKSLEMQLGHGNKKEQWGPHPILKPANMSWNFVSCGWDFTSAVTSLGSVYVWGRNSNGNLGVESYLHPQSNRKIVFKTSKGQPKTIDVMDNGSNLSQPTRFPFIVPSTFEEAFYCEVRKQNFVNFAKTLDPKTISSISAQLLKNPYYCLPAVYLHLLAGDLVHAIEFLAHIPPKEIEAVADNNNVPKESTSSTLIDVVWDLISKHPNFAVQSNMISDLLTNFNCDDQAVKCKKLCTIAPLILISKPEMLPLLNSSRTLDILEQWCPEPSSGSLQVSQNSLQNHSGRVRYWTCCGDVENCTTVAHNRSGIDKRRICPKCCEKWSGAVRAKLFRHSL